MKVEYPIKLNGKNIVVSEECKNDVEMLEFIHHMDELYGNMVCTVEDGDKTVTSDRVRLNIRVATKGKKEFKYYEIVCNDNREGKEACNYAKRQFGQSEDGYLFPKNYLLEKDEDGKDVKILVDGKPVWRPWTKYDPELGRDN